VAFRNNPQMKGKKTHSLVPIHQVGSIIPHCQNEKKIFKSSGQRIKLCFSFRAAQIQQWPLAKDFNMHRVFSFLKFISKWISHLFLLLLLLGFLILFLLFLNINLGFFKIFF
jgi:hypothetical protein